MRSETLYKRNSKGGKAVSAACTGKDKEKGSSMDLEKTLNWTIYSDMKHWVELEKEKKKHFFFCFYPF